MSNADKFNQLSQDVSKILNNYKQSTDTADTNDYNQMNY